MTDFIVNFMVILNESKARGYPKFSSINKIILPYPIWHLIPNPNYK